jgi:hypothetical protein
VEAHKLQHFIDNQLTGGGEVSFTRLSAPLYAREDSWYSFLSGEPNERVQEAHALFCDMLCTTFWNPSVVPVDLESRAYGRKDSSR